MKIGDTVYWNNLHGAQYCGTVVEIDPENPFDDEAYIVAVNSSSHGRLRLYETDLLYIQNSL